MIHGYHVSRSFRGPGKIEEECSCPKAECGMVIQELATCREHDPREARTIRSGHPAEKCLAKRGSK